MSDVADVVVAHVAVVVDVASAVVALTAANTTHPVATVVVQRTPYPVVGVAVGAAVAV